MIFFFPGAFLSLYKNEWKVKKYKTLLIYHLTFVCPFSKIGMKAIFTSISSKGMRMNVY